MTKKVSSKKVAEHLVKVLVNTAEKERAGLLDAFVVWLRLKGYWRKRREILAAVNRAWYKKQNLTPVTIITSAELTEVTKKELTDKLEKYFGQKLVITWQIKPSVMGGLTVLTEKETLTFTFQQLLNNLMQ